MEIHNRRKTGGRQKGTPNKLTATVRENFIAAFNRIGGHHALAEWAEANRTEFYKLYARLIPAQVQAEFTTLEQVIAETWDRPLKPLPESMRLEYPDASPPSTVADAEIVEPLPVGAEPEPH